MYYSRGDLLFDVEGVQLVHVLSWRIRGEVGLGRRFDRDVRQASRAYWPHGRAIRLRRRRAGGCGCGRVELHILLAGRVDEWSKSIEI